MYPILLFLVLLLIVVIYFSVYLRYNINKSKFNNSDNII